MKADRYRVVSNGLGWFGLVGSPAGLKAVTGPESDETTVRSDLVAGFASAREVAIGSDPAIDSTELMLATYAEGEHLAPGGPLDLEDGTPFQRSVWTALRQIPSGEVWTYGQVAAAIGRPSSARAVGQAVGANPLTVVVPCHRVVGSDGALTGFGGGLAAKEKLLAHEGRTDAAAQRLRTERRKSFRRTRREMGLRRGVGAAV